MLFHALTHPLTHTYALHGGIYLRTFLVVPCAHPPTHPYRYMHPTAAGLYTPRVGLLEEIIQQSSAEGADIMDKYVDPAAKVRPYLVPI